MNLEKFTDRARKVLGYAREEAKKQQHDAIYSHDILIGLLRESSGVAHFVLENYDLSIKKIRDQFEKEHSQIKHKVDNPDYTILSREVVEIAIEEAKKLNHNYVGTEHLLLAISRMPIMVHCGLNRDQVVKETMDLLGEYPYTFSPVKGTHRVEILEDNRRLAEYDTEEKKLSMWSIPLDDVSKILKSVEKYEEKSVKED